ncbi:hypothetical protein [Sinorhizobium americanum]|uniref:hypothetical protein n=1 Tax=Sinorhizobium americanum TaxID=194963 RepID=UPI0009320DAC|nr:hypothetical protein [Sinorhizobium americanum]
MALIGQGFMVVWHDIREADEPEYHRWHTREHMPERLGVPGFLRGRRGVDWSLARHRYLTLYEGKQLEVFCSAAYLQRLNNPTPWTNRLQPAFYNFIRSGCAVVSTTGRGVGGAMITIRLSFHGASEAKLVVDSAAITEQIMALDGVSSVDIGSARPEITSAKTRETELRGTTSDGLFDAVLLVDGIGRRELEAAKPGVLDILQALGWSPKTDDVAVYDMAYMLEPA